MAARRWSKMLCRPWLPRPDRLLCADDVVQAGNDQDGFYSSHW